MPNRVRIEDPALLEAMLERIGNRPRQYWLDLLAQYDNEKPGDIVLPGVPPRPDTFTERSASPDRSNTKRRAKKRVSVRREAA